MKLAPNSCAGGLRARFSRRLHCWLSTGTLAALAPGVGAAFSRRLSPTRGFVTLAVSLAFAAKGLAPAVHARGLQAGRASRRDSSRRAVARTLASERPHRAGILIGRRRAAPCAYAISCILSRVSVAAALSATRESEHRHAGGTAAQGVQGRIYTLRSLLRAPHNSRIFTPIFRQGFFTSSFQVERLLAEN